MRIPIASFTCQITRSDDIGAAGSSSRRANLHSELLKLRSTLIFSKPLSPVNKLQIRVELGSFGSRL